MAGLWVYCVGMTGTLSAWGWTLGFEVRRVSITTVQKKFVMPRKELPGLVVHHTTISPCVWYCLRLIMERDIVFESLGASL